MEANTIPDRDAIWTQVARVGGLAAGALGALALVGWLSGAEVLASLGGDRIPMAPSTAMLFLLFGTLLVIFESAPAAARPRRWILVLIGVGTVTAGLLFAVSTLGIISPLEHPGLEVGGSAAGGAPLGHMSPLTAAAFLLAGLAMAAHVAAAGPATTGSRMALLAAVVLEVLAVVLVGAYVLSRPLLYDTGLIPPALTTSMAFGALGLGLIAGAAKDVWPLSGAEVRLQPGPGYVLVVSLFVAAAVVIAGASVLFDHYQADYRREVEAQLLAIADLKVDQLEAWRHERFSDARTFHDNPVFADLLGEALYQENPRASSQLRDWLEPVRTAYQYSRVVAYDSTGRARVAVPDTSLNLVDVPRASEAATRAMRSGEITMEGFHRDTPGGPVHLAVFAPVPARGPPLGAVALLVEPEVFLYPTLIRWPVPSRTAETLLVRRDGDDVLFLNNLRFQDPAALQLRIPLSNADLPATQAVLGAEGVVEGVDYRGESVVAAVRAVPDTDWHLVARIDKEESFGPIRARLRLTMLLVGLLLFGLIGGVGFGWQRREKLYYRSILETEERQSAVLRSIGDAVIATDRRGQVTLMNPVAEELTGWSEAEAVGRHLTEVFHIVDEESRQPVDSPASEVMARGTVVGLANSTVLIARDGTERPIADSGAPVRDEAGEIVGVVLVFRDQTEQREARRRLEKEIERSQRYLDVAGVMIVVLDADGCVTIINRRGEEILGHPEDEILGKVWFEHFIPEEQRDEVWQLHALAIAGDATFPEEYENEVLTRDGEERTIRWRNAVVRNEDGGIDRTISSGLDVTARRRAEETLRRNEARYRNLVNSIRDAILVADTERKVIGCNPAFEDLFGYTEEEILGKHTVEVYASREEFEAMGQALQEHIGDPNFIQTVRYRKKSGEVFPGETNAFYLTDSDGGIVGFIGIIRDVSDREEAARALERSERRFRTLYEDAPVGIFRTDSTCEALAINRAMARILGFDTPEQAVEHYSDLKTQLYADPARRDEFVRILREEGHVDHFEYEALDIHGRPRWIEMNARLAETHADGTFEIEGFATDITERKRADRELRRQQTMLARTEAMTHLGSWELDVESGQVTWSEELFRIFQRDPEEGAPALAENAELFPENDLERLRVVIRAAIDDGEAYDLEVRALRPDGTTRICRARGTPEMDADGTVRRLYGSFRDVTEQKEREERETELRAQLSQAQKMESVGRLAGGVAHDFNNMLSVILGHAELAMEELGDQAELREELQAIHEAANHSADLTRQLLAFAREQIAAPEVLDLNETVESMLKMLQRVIGENIELVWQPTDSTWPVRIDPVQVDQILANLLVNARDAIAGTGKVTIETGSVRIEPEYAATQPDAAPGDFVTLVVSDTGSGMEPDVVDRIFEPFFSTKAQGEGTGLGLATVYGIVRQNGGFINVYSEPGGGTTFRIYLPRYTGEGERAATSTPSKQTEGGIETVLVVEDQPALLGLARKILEGLGYDVLTAATPNEAVEMAAKHQGEIELLLTDVVMPEMNGRELSEHLEASQPGLRTLFMSGYPSDVIADRGVLREGVRFLEKPFTVAQLAEKVRSALDA